MNAKIARRDVLTIVTWSCAGDGTGQATTLMRVNPYIPDSNFLVWKVEDRPGIVGGRMPLGLPKLSNEQIGHPWVDCWRSAGELD